MYMSFLELQTFAKLEREKCVEYSKLTENFSLSEESDWLVQAFRETSDLHGENAEFVEDCVHVLRDNEVSVAVCFVKIDDVSGRVSEIRATPVELMVELEKYAASLLLEVSSHG